MVAHVGVGWYAFKLGYVPQAAPSGLPRTPSPSPVRVDGAQKWSLMISNVRHLIYRRFSSKITYLLSHCNHYWSYWIRLLARIRGYGRRPISFLPRSWTMTTGSRTDEMIAFFLILIIASRAEKHLSDGLVHRAAVRFYPQVLPVHLYRLSANRCASRLCDIM